MVAKPVRALIGFSVLIVVALGLLGQSFVQEHPDLATLILAQSEIPDGFIAYPPLNGPLDVHRLQLLGISAVLLDHASGQVGNWRTSDGESSITVFILDDSSGARSAAVQVEDIESTWKKAGFTSFAVPSIAGGVGGQGRPGTAQAVLSSIAFPRGSLIFLVQMVSPAGNSRSGLIESVAEAQDKKAAARYGGTPSTSQTDNANALGGIFGAFLGYFGLAWLWGWFRDPVRARRRGGAGRAAGSRVGPRIPRSAGEVDVSEKARELRRRRFRLFLAELLGLAFVVGAGLPASKGGRLSSLVVGAGILIVARRVGRLPRPQSRFAVVHAPAERAVPSVLLFAASALVALLGAFLVLTSTLSQQDTGDSPRSLAGVCLLAASGISYRAARRLSAPSASRLLRADHRQMVLYLRSFGDDGLRLHAATLGRTSMLERFSPNRFDSFEEVLVRALSQVGPVVAINPSGIRLAPLGAARETLTNVSWQAVVDDWMERAALIVISIPPPDLTEGLMWELQQVSLRSRWDRSILVIPAVPDDELQRRWAAFRWHAPSRWPLAQSLPDDPSGLLALTHSRGSWTPVAGDRRNEWTYVVALRAAFDDLRSDARPSAGATAPS